MTGRAPFIGELVRLRALEPEDWVLLRDLQQDEEAGALGGPAPLPLSAADLRRLAEELSAGTADERPALVVTAGDGTAVGMLSVEHADRRNGVFRYGVRLLERYRRRGYGADAVRLLVRYYFEELGYQKAEAEVLASNEASSAFHEALGYHVEGRRRRAFLVGGRYEDTLLFGLTAEDLAGGPHGVPGA